MTTSKSPPPTTPIPLIRLSSEDDIIDGESSDIDINRRTVDGTAFSATASRVVEALETSGFMLVQSHHLPIQLQRLALEATNNIFDQHMKNDQEPNTEKDSKNDATTKQGVIHHPTDPKSYAMISCQSSDEISKDIQALRTNDQNQQGQRQQQDNDMEPINTYIEALEKVKIQILEYIAVGLNLPKDFFVDFHQKRNDALRLLQYHALSESVRTKDDVTPQGNVIGQEKQPQDAVQLRCKAHSDYGTITLLLTDGQRGLQAYVTPATMKGQRTDPIDNDDDNDDGNEYSIGKRKRQEEDGDQGGCDDNEGVWVDVPYVEGSLVVNIGSILSEWTNGRLLATLHRVIFMEDTDKNKSTTRTSLAFFADPDPDISTDKLQLDHNNHNDHDDEEDNKQPMSVSDYIAWRSGGSQSNRSGVAFTESEQKRIKSS